jgi:RNA polymerase sigma-70 factor (ECF subfamily)
LAERLEFVLDGVYAAYGSGWEDVSGADARQRGLTEEAIWLARLLVDLLPAEPEAYGLLALMLHCEARKLARRSPDGAFIPLDEQDMRLWSRKIIDDAERALADAAKLNRMGRFQIEAAIQSVHAQRIFGGDVSWRAIALLYEALLSFSPTMGVLVGRAAAIAEVDTAAAGLALLEEIPEDHIRAYQPYWALRGHLLRRLQRDDQADDAYRRAVGLSEDEAVRAFLLSKIGRVSP